MLNQRECCLTIHESSYGDNKCFVCNKYFLHSKVSVKFIGSDNYELRIRTSHPKCERTVKAIDKTRKQLDELEFDLFCLKD